MALSQDDYYRIGTEIAEETLERVRGWHRPYCVFDRPQDQYFVSSLAPQAEAEEGEFTESKPNNIGLKVQPVDETNTLDVEVSFELYYPSFPTRDEYEAWYEEVMKTPIFPNSPRKRISSDDKTLPWTRPWT